MIMNPRATCATTKILGPPGSLLRILVRKTFTIAITIMGRTGIKRTTSNKYNISSMTHATGTGCTTSGRRGADPNPESIPTPTVSGTAPRTNST